MFNAKNSSANFILISYFALLFSGCATNVGKTIKLSDAQLAQYGSISKPDAIAALGKRVADARSAELPLLAPHYYNEANELLTSLQTAPDSNKKNTWVADVAKANTLLDTGTTISLKVRERLPRPLALKKLLDQFNAAGSYPEDYKQVIEKLSDLIEKIELGKGDNFDKAQNELVSQMQVLDVKAVQFATLNDSDLTIKNTLSKLDAKLAPITTSAALHIYAESEKTIAAAPHNVEAVRKAGETALFAARRAWFIAERILALQKNSLEEIALEEEKYFSELSVVLGQKDLRDQALFNQEKIIASAAKSALQSQEQLKQTCGTAQTKMQSLEKQQQESEVALSLCKLQSAALTRQIADKEAQLKTLGGGILPAQGAVAPSP